MNDAQCESYHNDFLSQWSLSLINYYYYDHKDDKTMIANFNYFYII